MDQQQQNSAPTKSSIKSVIAKSTQDFPLLGNCLYWSFSETVIPHDEFKAILTSLGISEKLAPPTRKKSAVVKAVDEFIKTTGAKESKFRRKAVDDENVAVYCVVHSHVDPSNQDVTFATETKIFMDKATGDIRVNTQFEEVRTQILGLVKKYEGSYTADQIRATVLRYVFEDCAGIMVRDHGGLYFVPETHNSDYLKLRELVQTLAATKGINCSVDVIPVIDLPESRASLWKAVISDARAELSEMRKDIEEMVGAPSTRAQTLRLERYLNCKTKIQMYETLLNGTAQDLMKELNQIETLFKEKIGAN